MIKNNFLTRFSNLRISIDWKLLFFLILFLNVKLVVKVFALVLVYLWQFNFRFGLSLMRSRLPLFYPAAMIIVGLNWIVYGLYSDQDYSFTLLNGMMYWAAALLAIHQVRLSIEKHDPLVLHRTIMLFFFLNILVSVAVFLGIIIETGHLNPFLYQGNYQKYFIGTGDYVKGITFDTSTTNAMINALGVIYFQHRGKYAWAITCMCVLLLTGSNIINLMLAGVFIFLFVFRSNRIQKSVIVVCMLMIAIFMARVSPQNNKYLLAAWDKFISRKEAPAVKSGPFTRITERPDSTLNEEEKKEKTAQLYLDSIYLERIALEKKAAAGKMAELIPPGFVQKPEIPKDSIHTPGFQHKNDTNNAEKKLISFIISEKEKVQLAANKNNLSFRLPGKLVALKQVYDYFLTHPIRLITGVGAGNFSSKLAFRATGLNIYGNYPDRFRYINEDFKRNHLDLYLYYFTDTDDKHSIINSPNSTYGQMISEYGIAGLLIFFFLYAGYFWQRIKKNSYSLPIALLMLGAFFIEYWFEQLSVVVLYELLVLLEHKENSALYGER